MHDVLVIGELNIDLILDDIQGFPEIEKEILANRMTMTLGSSSAIFASNLSVLDTNVAFLGKIGTDLFANLVLDSLEEKGVNTDYIIKSKEHNTGATIVMNYGMERANVTFPGAMAHLTESDITDSLLRTAKHLHISSIFMQPGLKDDLISILRRAKLLGLTTSIDPQWDPAEKWDIDLTKLLLYVDVFLPNRQEFLHLTKCKSIAEGIDQVRTKGTIIIIKDGVNGALMWHNGKLSSHPAHVNKNVIDCIGAGDSFDAGFISNFIKGKSHNHCLEFGIITGAINTTAAGGTTAFKSYDQIVKLAKEKYQYNPFN